MPEWPLAAENNVASSAVQTQMGDIESEATEESLLECMAWTMGHL